MRNRLILLAVILGIAALGYFSGLVHYLSPDRMRELASEAGIWGPLLIVVLFSVLEPFFVPGAIFILAAATLWPFWEALLVNWLGATGAGMIGFAFARYFGRDWVEHRMPARLRMWDERLSSKGLPAVLLFRLVFFLNPASHWALGLSRVAVANAIVGTAIGFLPAVVLLTYFGAEILDWFAAQSLGMWVAVGAAIMTFVIVRRIRRRASSVEASSISTLARRDG
jgi:uncharacterized membrane protein YdjX (TVP38/TMEM64 family)